jgi:hypothetical protein
MSAPISRELDRQPKHTRVEGADTAMPSSSLRTNQAGRLARLVGLDRSICDFQDCFRRGTVQHRSVVKKVSMEQFVREPQIDRRVYKKRCVAT